MSTNLQSKLTINTIFTGGASEFDHSEAPLTITNTTLTSSTLINDPKAVLNLCRNGTTEQTYNARASFKLCRYENNSFNSRSRLDITLAHNVYDDITAMSIASNGNIGIGVTNPGFKLEVASHSHAAVNISARYLDISQVGTSSGPHEAICTKFNGGVWSTHFYMVSSDMRIKEDILDINDDSALLSILAIEPKTYKYIDKLERGNNKVYGFIAQQIKEVIPEAVKIEKSYIPNIYSVADYSNNVITLPSQPTKVVVMVNDKIKCYDKDNKEIIIDVIEVIDSLTFRIKELGEYTDTKIFIYGTFIDDFHTLNKDYIFTLNVCATQELHRRIEAQNIIIKAHEDRIKDLEEKVERLLTNT